jgi:hypothetical protein
MMKKPNNLPWIMGNDRKYSPNVIYDNKRDNIVLAPMGKKETGEEIGGYALMACNEFPIAVELLRECVKGQTKLDIELAYKVNQFLERLS